MTPTVVLKYGRAWVYRLPHAEAVPTHAKGLLQEILGPRRRVRIEGGGVLSVARSNYPALIEGLVRKFGPITVRHYAGTSTCVAECWGARPDTAHLCLCSCAGSNHGAGGPHGHEVEPGLSVTHEYVDRLVG